MPSRVKDPRRLPSKGPMKSKASSRTSKLKVRSYLLLMLGIAGSLLQPGLQTFALAAGVRSTGADTSDTPANRARADWWSFKPAIRPSVPEIAGAKFIIRNPVDNFVIARLTELKLAPSPEADRRTLIRRATFDLIGLPPSPEDVERFVADSNPDAYEREVDRLLASPRYGERWARHWLDAVHFGETHGYDKDKLRPNAWPFRDYVIRAFNADKPYSRFVQEQLAGDEGAD